MADVYMRIATVNDNGAHSIDRTKSRTYNYKAGISHMNNNENKLRLKIQVN